uniref:Uncharacterized protein n=1 Tax=Schistocephalus solidus TaxID=70667 RepID=A0A0X3NNU0_SCHSO
MKGDNGNEMDPRWEEDRKRPVRTQKEGGTQQARAETAKKTEARHQRNLPLQTAGRKREKMFVKAEKHAITMIRYDTHYGLLQCVYVVTATFSDEILTKNCITVDLYVNRNSEMFSIRKDYLTRVVIVIIV